MRLDHTCSKPAVNRIPDLPTHVYAVYRMPTVRRNSGVRRGVPGSVRVIMGAAEDMGVSIFSCLVSSVATAGGADESFLATCSKRSLFDLEISSVASPVHPVRRSSRPGVGDRSHHATPFHHPPTLHSPGRREHSPPAREGPRSLSVLHGGRGAQLPPLSPRVSSRYVLGRCGSPYVARSPVDLDNTRKTVGGGDGHMANSVRALLGSADPKQGRRKHSRSHYHGLRCIRSIQFIRHLQ